MLRRIRQVIQVLDFPGDYTTHSGSVVAGWRCARVAAVVLPPGTPARQQGNQPTLLVPRLEAVGLHLVYLYMMAWVEAWRNMDD